MIRILHVIDKLGVKGAKVAGPARQLAYRLPQYPRARFRTLVCSLRNEPDACGFLAECGVEAQYLNRTKFDVRALVDLQRLAAEWEPEVLHLEGYASWTFGRIVGRRIGATVVVQEHFVDDQVPAVQRLPDWTLRHQQAAGVAVADDVKRFMVEKRYLQDTPVEVIWNGIPTDSIRDAAAGADTASLRRSLGIGADTRIVGVVGRLAEEKGHRHFLDAAARLARNRPDVEFVIVGDGPLLGPLAEQAKRLGLRGKVHFVGHQDDVVPYYSLFSVLLLTSRREGFQLVPVEALAAGTPVVMSDIGAYRPMYVHDVNVLKVPLGDAEAAAAEVARLLDDPSLGERLLENAKSLLDVCSLDTVVERYLNLYDRLLH